MIYQIPIVIRSSGSFLSTDQPYIGFMGEKPDKHLPLVQVGTRL